MIPEDLYAQTGIQSEAEQFQLFAVKQFQEHILKETRAMLLVPDLLNYFLTGRMASEYTIASTTQLLDPVKRIWNWDLIDKLGLPNIFTDIIPPGTVLGPLLPEVVEELGGGEDISVVAVAPMIPPLWWLRCRIFQRFRVHQFRYLVPYGCGDRSADH